MLTLSGDKITTFENAEKLVGLGPEGVPAAAMISGAGDVNGKLVSILLRRAGHSVGVTAEASNHDFALSSVKNTIDPEWNAAMMALRADQAARHSAIDELSKINSHLAQNDKPPLTQVEPHHILIVGQTDNSPEAFIIVQPSILTVVVATYFDDSPRATALWWPARTDEIGLPRVAWWGSGSNPIQRLVLGFADEKLLNLATAEHNANTSGVPGPAETALTYLRSQGADFAMGLPIEALPLQDAIDFTEYLGKAAAGFDRFSLGPASVGGPLDVLVLHSGLREWIYRKHLHSSQA